MPRTIAMINRDIRTAESNLSLAIGDYEYLQRACNGFPALIERLSAELKGLRDEQQRFEAAPRREQKRWKTAGDEHEPVSSLGSGELLQQAHGQGATIPL